MKIFLTFFVLLFSSSVVAEDISDFEIEGMSLGDSLLNYMSEEDIKKEIKDTRFMYERLTEKFGEAYLYDGLKTYEYMSFFVKPNDEKFIIHAIRGMISFIEDIKGCHKKQKEIAEKLTIMFKVAKKRESSFKHISDPTGRSTVDAIFFILESGDKISIDCDDFEENLRIKNNWDEGLNVGILTDEFIDWMDNVIN